MATAPTAGTRSSIKRIWYSSANDGCTAEQKATLMTNVLVKRLGLGGTEFKICCQHLTVPFRSQVEAVAEVAYQQTG